ncbi:MAG TPA: UDP-N-acetylmuramoyl-L-alanyl-D-glutamate--2,6-diaminopimelate ligase [Burkholderiales bacterium]|nr:UDP-N-acetylmuramoyl-L-alanyl-D-glutamate--2,6-diaminopimelate ligase [Burkholderiales bacterium]
MIERLTSDSRRAAPGAAFFAWPGESADGRRFIGDAVKRGASAVVWEREGFSFDPAWSVPNAAVKNLREKAGLLAHQFYGRPSDSLWTCGVTGTNGKTTCSQWIAAALSMENVKSAVIGTLGSGFPPRLEAVQNTTPDALETHRLLREFKDAGAGAVAMEVSSHGLDQGRANGIAFKCALFTNLTHDHLDYHGTMAEYGEAKAKLFGTPQLETAVLNLDDSFGRELAKRTRAKTVGYSISGVSEGVSEFLVAEQKNPGQIKITTNSGSIEVPIAQVGAFNLSNALGVLGCLRAKGMPFAEAARLLGKLPAVPGRMQVVGERPMVVVDYAHTPDALEKVLGALRPVAAARGGRLAVVFGAGGDRDGAKRPLMGGVASRLADRVILTSDNPRSEDPAQIIEAIRRGTSGEVATDPDRESAIRAAIAGADERDVVLLAGKGHEATQEIAGRRLPFSDAAVAAAALGARTER